MEIILQNLFHHYGYFALFFLLALGVVGLPIPDEFLLTFAGYIVYTGEVSFALTLCAAFLGSVTGITINYWLGRSFGLPLLLKYGQKLHLTKQRIHTSQNYFQRFGKPLIMFGYFIPGIRHLTAYFAGMSSLSYRAFALYAYIGAFIWSLLFLMIGRIVGSKWYLVTSYVHKASFGGLALLIIVAGISYYSFKTRGRKSERYDISKW
ncbi:alkaline phosphatase [Fictibacillus enclensis]|uniref:Alkaline phosphatase n=1 Tax=Fictibacillus enclensis TaxID=1017270 RepID=A0A0V8J856_9BACL|nr:DedA family protein [Fictibacillus enclensis]KSU83318.1 alkaline phosphatase [Fictibacillus enclensis]